FEFVVVSLSFIFSDLIDKQVTALLFPHQAGYVTAALVAFGIPLTAFCLTISWSATILPANLIFHVHSLLTTTLQMNLSVEAQPKFKPRILTVLFALVALLSIASAALSFYYHYSLFITALTSIISITSACFIIDMECIDALRKAN
ncbi:hypothetical protein PMAYCL1PPCAC_10851, partial [Pristionchus mayeri]